jgi:hypothetical protein
MKTASLVNSTVMVLDLALRSCARCRERRQC